MSNSYYDYKLYVVTWFDSWSSPRYYDDDDDHTPMIIRNVGWLCENNDETIVICQSYSETGNRRGLIVIPHINIVSIEELVCDS